MRTAMCVGIVSSVVLLTGLAAEQTTKPASRPAPATTARPGAGQPATPKPAAPAPARTTAAASRQADGAMRHVASVRDIMHVLIEPAADTIFDSVAIEVTAAGVRDKKPETDEEWDELEHSALALAESVNLIKMANRPMARKSEMNVDPEGPELPPAEIEAKVRRSRARWNKYADELQDGAQHVLRLIESRDAKGLFEYGGALDMACENCHLEYWYPDDKKNRK